MPRQQRRPSRCSEDFSAFASGGRPGYIPVTRVTVHSEDIGNTSSGDMGDSLGPNGSSSRKPFVAQPWIADAQFKDDRDRPCETGLRRECEEESLPVTGNAPCWPDAALDRQALWDSGLERISHAAPPARDTGTPVRSLKNSSLLSARHTGGNREIDDFMTVPRSRPG